MTLMDSVSASCFPANHGKTSSSQDGTVRSDAANQGAAAELRRSTSRLAAVKWRGSALMKVKSRHRGLLRLNFSPQGWSLFLGVADKHKVGGQRSFLWLSSWNICLNLTKLYFLQLVRKLCAAVTWLKEFRANPTYCLTCHPALVMAKDCG